MNREFIVSLVFGIIFGTFFGGMDALFFLIAEEELTKYLEKDIRNRVILNLVEGALATCVSLLIAHYIETLIPFRAIKSPVLDCIGILFGTAIVAGMYYTYIKLTQQKEDGDDDDDKAKK